MDTDSLVLMLLSYRDSLTWFCKELIKLQDNGVEVGRILQHIPHDIKGHVIYNENYGGYAPEFEEASRIACVTFQEGLNDNNRIGNID